MKIATPYEAGNIFQHFGHSACFKIYEVADGQVRGTSLLPTGGSGHGQLAELLKKEKVDTLICGGIGGGAKNMLAAAGIRLYGGVAGSADEAVAALLAGTLQYNPNVTCSHHQNNGHADCHSGQGHSCGGHSH